MRGAIKRVMLSRNHGNVDLCHRGRPAAIEKRATAAYAASIPAIISAPAYPTFAAGCRLRRQS